MKDTELRITIRRAATGERKFIRRELGKGHFAHLKLALDLTPGSPCKVIPANGLELPSDFYQAAATAIAQRLRNASLGLPMIGFSVTLVGGSFREHYSTPEAFSMAGIMALEDALVKAARMVVEPWVGWQLRVDRVAVSTVLEMLAKAAGTLSCEITYEDAFMVRTQVPKREVSRLAEAFGIHCLEIFPLPMAERYRERRSFSEDLDRPTAFGEWT